MKIVVCFKVVPDDQDISIKPDRTLDYSKARPIVSTYDLNAMEALAQFACEDGITYSALTVGAPDIDDSKMKKNVLSRGPEALYMVLDEALAGADTHQTAQVLAAAAKKIGADLIVCGDGSADVYAAQAGVQLGEILGAATVNAVSSFSLEGDRLVVERTLEDETETLQLTLPAVVSVASDIAPSRICSMKEILAAGKKPVEIWSLSDIAASVPAATLAVTDVLAPEPAPRRHEMYTDSDADIASFAKKLSEVLV